MKVGSGTRPARPQSVKELVAQAENFTFNVNIPFKHWTRAVETLYQEVCPSWLPQSIHMLRGQLTNIKASFALSDGDYGRAYMMLYRHSVLVLKCLQTHPQFKDPESRKAFRPLSKRMDRVIADLEEIKPIINDEYAEWERRAPADLKVAKQEGTKSPSSYGEFAARDPSLSGNATVLDASENQELAVELAQKELARRDTVRHANRHTRVYGDTILTSRLSDGQRVDFSLQSQMEAARRAMESSQRDLHDNETLRPTATPNRDSAPQSYVYPSISKSKPVQFDALKSPIPNLPVPRRPPKEDIRLSPRGPSYTSPHELPAVPDKVSTVDSRSALHPSYETAMDRPLRPKTLEGPPLPKKERLAFKPGAYLENGDPIRSVFLPSKLRAAFLKVAAPNTRKGLEMCGILCGTPVNNALFVRSLLIPDQKCTSDTCETENESAIFDYCAGEDLMVLGWIHTHPTQTCFMSSRDLHTHAGYQVMMPESIAIVCAPRFTPS
ncbi:Mov34/MPN/PAD-1 [Metarhizium album ARSEF 1941]|uniref:Mov34/MPN/PAD-1 n=1 Tax=Metarhizium album (strain ARSEF 1941) TaxID=1081103 RepID=A0A0B2WV55_METAS|nr:Mov34/MPN/PAD-1 [Metarhizium album ARSEF 1941]KHN97327.1 Mov34/MPN/PAD-1 [Metarhizium album ARSEF 1941]